MRNLWGGRKAVVGVGAALVGLVLLVVLPAFATSPGQPIKPASIPKGIVPVDVNTGGQSNDCALFYGSGAAPAYQYRISNPKSQTYKTTVGAVTVSFTLTMNPPNTTSPLRPAYATDKYVSFSSTNAAIADVGIKGGTDTARYNYTGKSGVTGNPTYPSVASDGYLHAPAQSVDSSGNPTSLYSVSNLTFCFELSGSVAGTVYLDGNQSGTQNAGELGQPGWTVDLYKDVTAGVAGGGTLVGSTSTGASGGYSFALPLSTTSTYRVCESPPSGTWAQTQPLPSAANLCSSGTQLRKGYDFQPTSATQAITGKDFGNVGAVPCSDEPFGTSDGSYLIRLAECKEGAFFTFNSGTDTGKPFVSVFSADETGTKVPLVERIEWAFGGNAQNPFTVIFDDEFPFARADAHDMLYCKLEPRDGSEFGLDDAYDELAETTSVLPGSETSCLIQTTEHAETATGGTFVAYVYSSIDGWRSVG